MFKTKLYNTSAEKISITAKAGTQPTLPDRITMNYSDGISRSLPVVWEDTDNRTFFNAGKYIIKGKVSAREYPEPFIPERADPYILKGPDGRYYFTASYPAYMSAEKGYDRIILRVSDTVSGLASAQEHTLWYAHEKGPMSRHIWAPEIHFIAGKWYIFFAAGEKENVWNIRPYVLMCEENDPVAGKWTECGMVQASDTDDLSFTNFSLDMTHFEHRGQHYLIWAQTVGDSSLLMATTDPEKPWVLTGKPIILTRPEYPWEKVRHRVNEGASVLKTDEKIYVFFSASGTGSEYCMGVLYADSAADLMKAESWTKVPYPILQTDDLTGANGPGHNSFVTDEKGNLLLVYHARPDSHLTKECGCFCEESLYDPCRHARIKKVFFKEGKIPLINLSDSDILSPENMNVTAEITVV